MALSYRDFSLGLTFLATSAISTSSLMPLALALEPAQNLTVEISGLRNQKGFVCIALFDGASGFPMDASKAVKNSCFKVASTTQEVNLGPLKAGRYAMSLLHDENADQKLNTGLFGIPREGIGFSRNPRIRRRLQFEETSFDFQPNATTVPITVKYF